jgi:hypothetical protein
MFWPGVFSWTSTFKLLAKPGNVGNFDIRWCDFLHDGSLCEGRAGAGVFLDTLDIWESYAFGSLTTVSQTVEVYSILACSDFCRSANMHKMMIFKCSDSKAALLALSYYTISSKLLYQSWLSLQDLSYNNRVALFWVSGHCDIKSND